MTASSFCGSSFLFTDGQPFSTIPTSFASVTPSPSSSDAVKSMTLSMGAEEGGAAEEEDDDVVSGGL